MGVKRKPLPGNEMPFAVIEGGRAELEKALVRSLFEGEIDWELNERLRRRSGRLRLVGTGLGTSRKG